MALVFQEYSRSLFPWMTVRQNVAFPLRRRRLDKAAARELVEGAVESVALTGALDRYPWELSGGMQQRVAIARALAYQPEIMLMDEPFASVDAQTRADLEDLVLEVRRQYGVTVVFVTHDIDESVYLGDRVVVLTPAPTHVQETSGTTGRPLRVLDTAEDWAWWRAAFEHAFAAAGIGSSDRGALAFSFGPHVQFWAAKEGLEALGAMVVPLGGMTSVHRLETIARGRASAVHCTPTYR